MEIAKIILEYCRVILSAPVMIAVAAITFFVLFREDLKALFLRIAMIRLPGGAELLTSQSQRQEREAEHSRKPIPEASLVPVNLPELPIQNRQEIENIIKSERANAYLWEYRYLNYFFVYRTQQVLDWLASVPQPVSLHPRFRLLTQFALFVWLTRSGCLRASHCFCQILPRGIKRGK
jgi:hypothetical protein